MNKEKHKYYMFKVLTDIFADHELNKILAFKGGTSLMFFHRLPRFSVDLDFNIIDVAKKNTAYQKVRDIVLRYGSIADENMKHFGPIVVLDYGKGERKLKVELSTHCYNNHYETKNLSGEYITIMKEPDMFAHKLCALTDRKGMTGRDVFDIYFFLEKGAAINPVIIEQRMKKTVDEYLDYCITALKSADNKALMANVGDLLEGQYKNDMRSGKILSETIKQLSFYKFSPILENYPENRMPISDVEVIKNYGGDSILKAIIAGERYADRILTRHEKECLAAYPEQEDKHNYLLDLAKGSYFDAWNKRERNNGRGKSLKL